MLGFLLMALLLGLGGSLHCLAMCGPLVLRLPFSAGERQLAQPATYYVGKALAYGCLGLIFGFIGKGFLLFNWQQVLSVVGGIFILALAFLPRIQKVFNGKFFFSRQLGALLVYVQKEPSLSKFFLIGFLNGFLPCGLIYTALAGATVTANPLYGFTFMFVFGMGTVPALSILAFTKKSIQSGWRSRLKNFSFILSVLVGVLLILRGLNLNIPYVSPYFSLPGQPINCHT